jgi:hypothetical protein
MEHEEEFELEEFEISVDGRDYSCTLHGEGYWGIDNDSFDYAGTHCTHGQSGTHHLPDYATIQTISLSGIDLHFEVYDKFSKRHADSEIKFVWRFENHRDFITQFEKEHYDLIKESLQELEDDNKSVIESIKECAEEAKYAGRL